MPIFSPHKLILTTDMQDAEVRQVLQQMVEKSPSRELSMLHGDLHQYTFEFHWKPQSRKAAAIRGEGKLLPGMDGTDIQLQLMLEPAQQISRLIWLGFLGLLFFLTMFGPPPIWTSIFPLAVMIMMYFTQEQRFSDSARNLRALLCAQLKAEVVED